MTQRRKRLIKPKVRASRGYLMVGFTDFYRMYYSRTKTHIPKGKANKIMRRIAELVWPKVIKDYYRWVLPARLGSIYISEGSKLHTYRYKDWARYHKTNEVKININFSLDGRKPYVKYSKGSRIPRHLKYYRLKPTRGHVENCTGHRGLWGYINSLETEPYRPHLY